MKKRLGKRRNWTERSKTLRFERLESRELLSCDGTTVSSAPLETESTVENWYSLVSSSINPTKEEQELLEQINRFRADPQGELSRIFSVANEDDGLIARNGLVNEAIKLNFYPKNSVESFLDEWRSLDSAAPLAFNAALESAAQAHSSTMKRKKEVSHVCAGEANLATRVENAGFVSGLTTEDGKIAISENVGGGFAANGEWSVASYILAAFSVDWGVQSHEHRDALINDSYTEIGVSVVQTTNAIIGPTIVTCDFGSSVEGSSTGGAYLLGAIYDDADGDYFYDAGEGLADASILIERIDGAEAPRSVTIKSWTAGGYQIFLANGNYRVTVSGASFATSVTKNVSIDDGVNAKLDFCTRDAGTVAPQIDLNGYEEGANIDATFVEGAEEPASLLDAARASIVDPDSTYLFGAKIVLTERPDAFKETLDVSLEGTSLRATFEEGSSQITITGTGSIEEYERVLSTLTYFNSSELCDLSSRVVSISVYDGAYWSEEAYVNVAIQATVLPQITVCDAIVYEGDGEETKAVFNVELDMPARMDVSFTYEFVEGTAEEGVDFILPEERKVLIPAGETNARFEATILGDLDPLKSTGLKPTENGFEKASLYFYLTISDVANGFLTNENALAKGTIIDDDSPVVLGVADQYSLLRTLDVEGGARRYVFTLSPEHSGLYAWTASSESALVSVRKDSLEGELVASATKKAQWFADPDVVYWIVVESNEDVESIIARLAPIDEGMFVLVDPLLEDADEDLVRLAWGDEGTDLTIGDWSWTFDSANWGGGAKFRTTRDDVGLEYALTPSATGTVSTDDDGTTTLDFDDDSNLNASGSGFSYYVYRGSDSHEEITIAGTTGDDYLYYSQGSGYLQRSDGLIHYFDAINKTLVVGNGGNDVAYVEDSRANDQLETSNGAFSLYGGGYALSARDFAETRIVFVNGGDDAYYARDFGDDVQATIAKGTSFFSGTFLVDASDEQEEGEDAKEARTYARTVVGVKKTILAPTSSIGSATFYGEDSENWNYDFNDGVLTVYESESRSTTNINRVKSFTTKILRSSSEDESPKFTAPEGYAVSVEGDYFVITRVFDDAVFDDADVATVALDADAPLVATGAESACVQDDEGSVLDRAVENWDVLEVSEELAVPLQVPTFDVFESIRDVFASDERTRLGKRALNKAR